MTIIEYSSVKVSKSLTASHKNFKDSGLYLCKLFNKKLVLGETINLINAEKHLTVMNI